MILPGVLLPCGRRNRTGRKLRRRHAAPSPEEAEPMYRENTAEFELTAAGPA